MRDKEKPMLTSEKWQDWTSFVLGLWLAVSPWIAGYDDSQAATANAAFAGVALALGAHLEVGLNEAAVEWLTIAIGLWLLAAPFALGFDTTPVATVNCVAVGSFVAALSASALEVDKGVERWLQRRSPGIRP
jgi:hypothetical protein